MSNTLILTTTTERNAIDLDTASYDELIYAAHSLKCSFTGLPSRSKLIVMIRQHIEGTSDDIPSELRSDAVVNFMDGISFRPQNPLMVLKLIAASSIFGEPSYYRASDSTSVSLSSKKPLPPTVLKHLLFPELYRPGDATTQAQVFVDAIDSALSYDFEETLRLAEELRNRFFMRLNPNIIFMRAALHPDRVRYNKQHPGIMKMLGSRIISRPDDIKSQLEYYIFLKKVKNNLPGIIKRTWALKLSTFSRYQLKKYLNQGKLIDIVRLSHAHSTDIDEMMKTGNLKVSDEEKTWEQLKSSGLKWKEIFNITHVPHMALLRNLRGIAKELSSSESDDRGLLKEVTKKLVSGVATGKQFPFRYFSAYREVQACSDIDSRYKTELMECLEECLEDSLRNFPHLKGRTISLCDNSGSAWGTFNSRYGTVTVAEIANLSGIITARNSEEGEVGFFGDRLEKRKLTESDLILDTLTSLNGRQVMNRVGGGTENGIWIFFRDALKKKEFYDNIFIYSDMQAGHGGLFGVNSRDYKQYVLGDTHRNIDVLKLIAEYRKLVNPKVNVFSVQVAGYDNSLIPETLYRGAVLSGWTGNEVSYAVNVIDIWDEMENV